jgi:hypothetical protein
MQSRSPFNLMALAFTAMFVNWALVLAALGMQFYPSELAVYLGLAYGSVCAMSYWIVARTAARRTSALTERQQRLLAGALTSNGIFCVALIQLICGFAALSHGAAAIYTLNFGDPRDATHLVTDVKMKTRPTRCFKHRFAEFSWFVNNFYGPCTQIGYPVGSRFDDRGRYSPLGFQYVTRTVEINGVPLRRRASND